MRTRKIKADDDWPEDEWYSNILGTGSYHFIGVSNVKSKMKNVIGFIRPKKKRKKEK